MSTHVDFAILEALLQVVIDGLVGDLANQCKIRDADFLLLSRLKDGLGCELLLLPRTSGSGSASILLAPGALSYRLYKLTVSVCRVVVADKGGLYHG